MSVRGETPGIVTTGLGYDCHRFAAGRRLVLGGVELSHDRGLEGHSDADVLTHAIIDGLLGAAALGDIGQHFPDTDPRWKNASSQQFLVHARNLLRQQGFELVSVDATVILERPKLNEYRYDMREKLAAALELEV